MIAAAMPIACTWLVLATPDVTATLNVLTEGAADIWHEGRTGDNLDDPRPRERVAELRGEVYVRIAIKAQPWLRGVLSAFGSTSADTERPPEGERFLLFNGARSRGSVEERLGEANLQLAHQALTVRAGKQFIRWGVTPFLSPNNVLEPLDLRRGPFARSADPDAPGLPVWALRSLIDLGRLGIDLAWLPFFQPHRMSLIGDDFAAYGPQPLEDRGVRALVQRAERELPRPFQGRADVLAAGGPEPGLASSQVGARVTLRGERWQAGLQYTFAFEPYPVVKPNAELLDAVRNYYEKDPSLRDPRVDFGGVAAALEAGEWFWTANYRRMHHLGAEGELTLGDFHLTVELAYSPRRTVYARSSRAADASVIAGAGGLVFAPSERLALFAGVTTVYPFLKGPAAELVFGWTHRALAGVMGGRAELFAHLALEASVITELDRSSYAASGRLIWRRWRAWEAYLALDIFGGATDTVGARWDANDQVAAGLRGRY